MAGETKTELVEYAVGDGKKVYMDSDTASWMRQHFAAMPTGGKGIGLSEAADIAGLAYKFFGSMRIRDYMRDLEDARAVRRKASANFKKALTSPSTTPVAVLSDAWDKYERSQAAVDRLQNQITDTHLQVLYISMAADATKVISALSDRSMGYDMMPGNEGTTQLLGAAGLGAIAGGFVSWSFGSDSRSSRRRMTRADFEYFLENEDELED